MNASCLNKNVKTMSGGRAPTIACLNKVCTMTPMRIEHAFTSVIEIPVFRLKIKSLQQNMHTE